MKINRHSTDVLIIGGGVTGLNAAISARQEGQEVLIMDKACIERSGHIAGGIDHFLAYMNTGPAWDTRDAYLDFTHRSSRGVTNIDVAEAVYCDNLDRAFERFDYIKCDLHHTDGVSYYRTQSYGQPGPWWINFNGKKMKPLLAKAARRAGAKVLERVVTADLLTHDGIVCGAVGFDIRSGEFHVVHAKAVVLATGGTNRLYSNPSGVSFNTWMCPADTGDGEAITLRAGGELANIEFLRMTIVPRSFSAAGLNAFSGIGAVLINAKGEPFMENYHPQGMKAVRSMLVQGVLGELRAGRGPVYMDCRNIDKETQAHLVKTLSYDKDSFQDYFAQMNLDLTTTPMEVDTSEGMQGGPSEVCGSGIKINTKCGASIPGLYAGGNSADQCRALHMAVTSGIHSGRMAAEYAKTLPKAIDINEAQVEQIYNRVYAPLLDTNRPADWHELELALQRLMTEGAGPVRTGVKLENAKNKLAALEKAAEVVGAKTPRDLLRLHEVHNLLTVGQCTVRAALFREESRFGTCHYREDFPELNDEKFLGQVVITRSGEDWKFELRPTCDPYEV